MTKQQALIERFHTTLVEAIRTSRPEYLHDSFTVAEIYQNLIPYRSHRDVIGVEMNGDYENALLRLLGGEGGFLLLESEVALREIRNELLSSNPNTGLYREFAAAEVRLNPDRRGDDATGASLDDARSAVDGAVEAAPDADGGNGRTVLPFQRPSGAADGAARSVTQCPQCREVLPDRAGLRFCPGCGTDVFSASCSSCGEELESAWRYCVSCGTRAAR